MNLLSKPILILFLLLSSTYLITGCGSEEAGECPDEGCVEEYSTGRVMFEGADTELAVYSNNLQIDEANNRTYIDLNYYASEHSASSTDTSGTVVNWASYTMVLNGIMEAGGTYSGSEVYSTSFELSLSDGRFYSGDTAFHDSSYVNIARETSILLVDDFQIKGPGEDTFTGNASLYFYDENNVGRTLSLDFEMVNNTSVYIDNGQSGPSATFYRRVDQPGTMLYLRGNESFSCSWADCPSGPTCGVKVEGDFVASENQLTLHFPDNSGQTNPFTFDAVFDSDDLTLYLGANRAGDYEAASSRLDATRGDSGGYCRN